MRKGIISIIMFMALTGGILLAGCAGNNAGNVGTKPDTSSGSTPAETSGNDKEESSQDTEDKAEGKFKKSGEMPVLLRHRRFEYEHNDAGQLAIDHKYSFFSLDKDYAASHEELAASLDKARDGIETLEKRKRSEESKTLKENQQYSYQDRDLELCEPVTAHKTVAGYVPEYEVDKNLKRLMNDRFYCNKCQKML